MAALSDPLLVWLLVASAAGSIAGAVIPFIYGLLNRRDIRGLYAPVTDALAFINFQKQRQLDQINAGLREAGLEPLREFPSADELATLEAKVADKLEESEQMREVAEERWSQENQQKAREMGIEGYLEAKYGPRGVQLIKEVAGDERWQWCLEHPELAEQVLAPIVAGLDDTLNQLNQGGSGVGGGGVPGTARGGL